MEPTNICRKCTSQFGSVALAAFIVSNGGCDDWVMFGDFFGISPQGEQSPSKENRGSIFGFEILRSPLGSPLGSPQVPQTVPQRQDSPLQAPGRTCNCCGTGAAAFDQDALGLSPARGPSVKISDVKDVMRHWADVDGDFLAKSGSFPTAADPKTDGEHSEDREPQEQLQSHGSPVAASPADDWAQEILQDIEQFGHPNVLDHFIVMLLKRAQSRRINENT